jgi:hypothetical protein
MTRTIIDPKTGTLVEIPVRPRYDRARRRVLRELDRLESQRSEAADGKPS